MSAALETRTTAWDLELSLGEIIAEFEADEVDEARAGELLAVLVDALRSTKGKRDALAAARLRKISEIELLEQRARDAKEKAGIAQRALDRLDGYILSIMDTLGEKKLAGNQWTISRQQNPESVQIAADADIGQFAAQHVRVIPESYSPDKKAIAADLKAGKEVPYARLVHGAWRIVVR